MNRGKVFLIGAGPGEPGLLTCRAKQLLSECDVVCYDKLVSAAILSLVPRHIQLHEVGYLGYQGKHIRYGMHPDVIEFAMLGKSVARLKSGDPCIFGRTTEECRDLNAHGIAYEIVPGITAALGAAAYSGFPLTSGGVASSVTFVSGHQHLNTISSWGESGQAGGTLVLYMGAKKLAEHVSKLMQKGRSPETPIALISSATRADHACLVATLGTVVEEVQSHKMTGPTLTIIGDVVDQRCELNWRSQLPLSGARFLVCGEYDAIKSLQDKGAEVISIADVLIDSLLDREALGYLAKQKALAFDDLAAVNLWKKALRENQWDIRTFSMPMGSHNSFARNALQSMGIYPEPLSENTLTLTLNEDGLLGENSNGYLIGRRSDKPLGYSLPKIDWVLAENKAVVQLIARNQPDVFSNAELVPLSKEVYRWAQDHGYHSKGSDGLEFVEFKDLMALYECADVA